MLSWKRCLLVAAGVWFKPVLFVGVVTVTAFGEALHARCVATEAVVIFKAVSSLGQPLKIIAFGTSLMWGNGLKDRHSFRYLVAKWLAEKSFRPVALATFAHSAALLGVPLPGETLEGAGNWGVGDLNSPELTCIIKSIAQQV